MRRLLLPAATAALLLLPAVPAHAGTYQVRSCVTSTGSFANEAWTLRAATGVSADTRCGTSATDGIGLSIPAGNGPAGGAYAALTFTSPTGTTITDWQINRTWTLRGAAPEGNRRPYLTYVLGGKVFGGAGHYTAGVRDELNKTRAWGGYPERDFAITSVTPRSSWRALAGAPASNVLSVRVGCLAGSAPCKLPAGGSTANTITGSVVTVDDPRPPTVSVEASGLLAGGPRSGSDPIRLTASDVAGIKRVEAIDVTDPAAPAVVAAESYDPADPSATTTDARTRCSYAKPAPCPNLSGETVTPTQLQAGRRTLIVRVHDGAGNITDQGPYSVEAATPSDRGVPNGSNATDTATIDGRFVGKRKRPRNATVGFRARPRLRGALRNAAGQPVAGATLHVVTRRAGSRRWARSGTITTGPDGSWALRASRGPSRQVQVGWRARINDAVPAAAVRLNLRVRGSASLKAPRSVRVGQRFTLRGQLRGVDRRQRVSISAQGRTGGQGYQPFGSATRTDERGRIRIGYRFTQPSSRGRTFRLRVKLLPTRGWPYSSGTTKTVRVRVR